MSLLDPIEEHFAPVSENWFIVINGVINLVLGIILRR